LVVVRDQAGVVLPRRRLDEVQNLSRYQAPAPINLQPPRALQFLGALSPRVPDRPHDQRNDQDQPGACEQNFRNTDSQNHRAFEFSRASTNCPRLLRVERVHGLNAKASTALSDALGFSSKPESSAIIAPRLGSFGQRASRLISSEGALTFPARSTALTR